MNELTPSGRQGTLMTRREDAKVYVTLYISKQLFGIDVERVQDILIPEAIAHIPLAPPEVAGAINLRGRIVTVIDVRNRLGLKPLDSGGPKMCVTVEQSNDLYSLMVDSVGEVVSLSRDQIEPNPSTLDARWREISHGVVRLKGELLVVMDVDRMLTFTESRGH